MERANLFEEDEVTNIDLSIFTPKNVSRKKTANKQTIKEISENNSFKSRESSAVIEGQPRVLKKKAIRKEQLSSRVQVKHHELFYKMVNETGKLNAEIMEMAIEALAQQLNISGD